MTSANNIINCKVLLGGMSNSGKSSLIKRFVDDTFMQGNQPTVGPEVSQFIFHSEDLTQSGGAQLDKTAQEIFDAMKLRLTIFDCPGQDSSVAITPSVLRNADAAFICFDVTYRPSFEQVEKWLNRVRSISPNALCILVGCKCDMEDSREIQRPEADALARQLDLAYFETSAKENSNVEPTFKFVAVNIRQKWYANRPKASSQTNAGRVNIGADQKRDQEERERRRKEQNSGSTCCK